MVIKYSPDKKIKLSLKDKNISKEIYQSSIVDVVQCGKKNDSPKVSVVIVAYNERDDLIRNLEHWQKQTSKKFEIILVDNGLDDKIVEKIKIFNLLYIKVRKNLGCSGGRNIGAVYANSDILIFGDADGYNSGDYIENILNIMQDKEVIAVRGKVLPINEKLQREYAPGHYDIGEGMIPAIMSAEGNSAWRTDDFIKSGGFEETLAGGEGFVLQYRMINFYKYKKNSFRYDPSIILYHDYHQTYEKLKYKIQQNYILTPQINVRYPFLSDIKNYYYSFYRQMVSQNRYSKEYLDLKRAVRSDIKDKFKKIYDRSIENRYQTPSSLLEGEHKDFSVLVLHNGLIKDLKTTIISILNQTLANIEIIVISSNKDIQQNNEYIRAYAHVVNVSSGYREIEMCKVGCQKAKGAYTLCIDAGDIMEHTYLEKLKNISNDKFRHIYGVNFFGNSYRHTKQIKQLQHSKSFRLGDLFFRSIKEPYKLITFPINCVKIIFDK